MRSHSIRTGLSLAFLLSACASPGGDPSDGSSTSSASTTSAASTTEAPTTGQPADAVPIERAAIERLAGSWVGPVKNTPIGELPQFPMNLAWVSDDELASETPFPGGEGYFKFRFVRVGEGRWSLIEEGALPGGMVQSYTLDPVEIDGDTTRWSYLPDPAFLTVVITVSDDTLVFDTLLRGQSHAIFDLKR